MSGLSSRPAAVVLPERRSPATICRLRVGLLQLRPPEHDKEAEVRRYSVSSSFPSRSYYSGGVKLSTTAAPGTPEGSRRYSVSSEVDPSTPRSTGSGSPHSPPDKSPLRGAAAAPLLKAHPGGTGARSGPRHESAASAARSRGRRCNTAAGRAGGGEVPRPRSLASRGVRELCAKLARSQSEARAKPARRLREASAKPARSRREAWARAPGQPRKEDDRRG